MEFVGFFRELDPDGSADICSSSLTDAAAGGGSYPAAPVITYLESGFPILDVMESTPDPFAPGQCVKGGPSLLTDGIWIWRHDLAHYVERYQVALPDAFLQRMAEADHAVGEVDLEVLRELAVEVSARLGYR